MIKVIVNAKFPSIKPAHHAFITKQGQGGSWAVAVKDAVSNIAKDERLKGKRGTSVFPATFTVNLFMGVDDE